MAWSPISLTIDIPRLVAQDTALVGVGGLAHALELRRKHRCSAQAVAASKESLMARIDITQPIIDPTKMKFISFSTILPGIEIYFNARLCRFFLNQLLTTNDDI